MEELKRTVHDIDERLNKMAALIIEGVNGKQKTERVWDLALRVLAPLSAGILAAAVLGLFNLHDRVRTIENTRFTRENYVSESAKLVAPLLTEIAKLSVQLEETRKDLKLVTERLIRIEAEVKK